MWLLPLKRLLFLFLNSSAEAVRFSAGLDDVGAVCHAVQ